MEHRVRLSGAGSITQWAYALPEQLKAPLFGALQMSAQGWFNLLYGFLAATVLVAELMTFGRLSQDNEITALRAGGVLGP